MINFCSRKGVYCTSATDFGSCCATACMKKPDYVEVLSFEDVKIIGSDGREYIPVVRCEDCKYGMTGHGIADGLVFCSKPYTERGNAMHRTDWFCADGERRDDGQIQQSN